MESLRWILLVAGVVFVLALYFLGRNRRRKNNSDDGDQYDDLPEFSAKNLDDLDDSFDDDINDVRITNSEVDAFGEEYSASQPAFDRTAMDRTAMDSAASDNGYHDSSTSPDSDGIESASVDSSRADTTHNTTSTEPADTKPSGIIVLYILAKPNQELLGSHINSSVQAMGLSFGDMNIFHYRPGHRNIFSLANMLEPGSFDADTIHDIKTSGLTIFMQISGNDPMDDLTEMLQRSYQLAGLLDAILCNSKRKPLTEQDAENYRSQVRAFLNG